jgi:mono/diheme cytochrome c family protein
MRQLSPFGFSAMRKLPLLLAFLFAVVLAALWWFRPIDRQNGEAPAPAYSPAADSMERGRELVTVGDCKSCHTARGGSAFAGGHAIPTPFGTFFSPNITSDARTGIGGWSAEDFWHALHNGYAKDGTLLYPTFPYTNYTKISRRDADAMYAYLKSVPAVSQANRAHELAFPYSRRILLVAWRYLFFRPGVYEPDPARGREWNRGAYLIQGLGHCSACHEARNALGAIRSKHNPSGGLVLSWYAPALTSPREAGVQDWTEADIGLLLTTGQTGTASATSRHASTMGPMAEVVHDSLQYVRADELRAMAAYLKSLPTASPPSGWRFLRTQHAATVVTLSRGGAIYTQHCASCHGDAGQGHWPAGPPLAGNRAVTMPSAVDPIRIVLFGGYPPGTAGNPRPFGMPPYLTTLSDAEIGEVLSYVRWSWGNGAAAVSGDEVAANRGSPLW